MDSWLSALSQHGYSVLFAAVFLEVEDDNPPARRLYAGRGFLQVGERRGYYVRADGRASTALILRRDLG